MSFYTYVSNKFFDFDTTKKIYKDFFSCLEFYWLLNLPIEGASQFDQIVRSRIFMRCPALSPLEFIRS